MIRLRLDEVAAATGGRLAGGALAEAVIEGPVVIDSREVTPGALFVAFAGERVDGHDYAAAAVGAGAVAVLAAREVTGPAGAPVPTLVVADPQRALGALARAVRDRLTELTVIAITGSSGKTSTKDLLAEVLAAAGLTVAPRNSFNNEIGVPLTALGCDEQSRYLVSEMGAREPGNIAYLCDLVAPQIGVVLNVGAAHAGVFGSREVTAATKGELVEALPAAGLAVLNADDPAVAAMASRTAARVVRTGTGPSADIRAVGIALDGKARPAFTLQTPDGAAPVRLRLHGRHHVGNALAAAAAAIGVGMDVNQVADLLSAARARSSGRMSVYRRGDGVIVIDDAYNANPDSVAAALAALVAMARDGRSWVVLGEMLELGDQSAAEHFRLGRLSADLGVDHLVAVGPGARPAHQGALEAGARTASAVEDLDAAEALLRERLRPGDVVLVKASRAIGLDRLARRLIQVPEATAGSQVPETPGAAAIPLPAYPAGQDDAGAGGLAAAGRPREVGA
jgi:UDP-N-acetylmuramoyl-tripeptide--D-alanyl-D-alanine ligase